jgi:hypothetical protein
LPSDDSIILNGGHDEFCDSLTNKLVIKHQTLTQSHTDTEMLNIDTASSSSMSNNDISPLVSLPSLISAYANNHDHEKIESSFNIQVQVDNQYCPQGQQNTPNTAQSHFSCSPYLNEINCNTNAYYDYDYPASTSSNNTQQFTQKSSPMYVYHQQQNQPQQQAFTDYASANTFAPIASPLQAPSSLLPQQQHPSQSQFGNSVGNGFYSSYPYMYDPNMIYSPVQATISSPLTSPQQSQSVSILNSYQTPPQPQQHHHHQLYISANSSSGDSTAPNSSSTSTSELLTTSTNSSPQNQQSTALLNSPQPNTYMVYPPPPPSSNGYMTNTPQGGFHSPMPTSSSPYMMYSQPSPIQAQGFASPLPSSLNSSNSINYKFNNNVNNKQNRFNNNKGILNYNNNGNNNYKKSNHQRSSNLNNSTNSDQTHNQYTNNSPANVSCCADETNTSTNDQCGLNNSSFSYVPSSLPITSGPLYSPPMPNYGYEYYDPNTLVQMGINPMTYDYGHSNITTYGEDVYDENYDDSNLDDNEEQLACYTCRGRRMCFCYFLKVRYYKFPSFFDLVDHQYKKWRQTVNRSKRAVPQ